MPSISNPPAFSDRKLKALLVATSAAAFGLVTWALVSPDPFAAVQRTPFSFLRTVSDLALHFAAFSVVATMAGCLIASPWETTRRKLMVATLIAYAIGTELIQQGIPQRTCDPMDAAANLCGIAGGLLFASQLTRQLSLASLRHRS